MHRLPDLSTVASRLWSAALVVTGFVTADLWALGVMLLELINNQSPFAEYDPAYNFSGEEERIEVFKQLYMNASIFPTPNAHSRSEDKRYIEGQIPFLLETTVYANAQSTYANNPLKGEYHA